MFNYFQALQSRSLKDLPTWYNSVMWQRSYRRLSIIDEFINQQSTKEITKTQVNRNRREQNSKQGWCYSTSDSLLTLCIGHFLFLRHLPQQLQLRQHLALCRFIIHLAGDRQRFAETTVCRLPIAQMTQRLP